MLKNQLFRAVSHSLISVDGLRRLVDLVQDLDNRCISGDMVECGVWKGGSAALISWAARRSQRALYLYDSFSGLRGVSQVDVKASGTLLEAGTRRATVADVRRAFASLDAPIHRTKIIKGIIREGFFNKVETPEKVAFLHIDVDLYEPHLAILGYFYDRVETGGVIVFDDYLHFSGVRNAVDEFFQKRKVKLNQNERDGALVFTKE